MPAQPKHFINHDATRSQMREPINHRRQGPSVIANGQKNWLLALLRSVIARVLLEHFILAIKSFIITRDKPVTNIIVDIILDLSGSVSSIHNAGQRMNGIATMAPIMVR